MYRLPPHTVTSRHLHLLTEEVYHILDGEGFLEVEGDELPVNSGRIALPPVTIHSMRTGDSVTWILIEMLGNPDGLSMEDHYYFSRAVNSPEN